MEGERQLQPSTVTCNAAISACEKSGHWQSALGIFRASGDVVAFFCVRFEPRFKVQR